MITQLLELTLEVTAMTTILRESCSSNRNRYRGGDNNLKVGVPVLLLFLLLHTNNTCEIIYVHVRRTDGRTKSARSRLRVVRGQKKWGGWAPPNKNLGGLEHPLPPLFLHP